MFMPVSSSVIAKIGPIPAPIKRITVCSESAAPLDWPPICPMMVIKAGAVTAMPATNITLNSTSIWMLLTKAIEVRLIAAINKPPISTLNNPNFLTNKPDAAANIIPNIPAALT